MARAAELQYAPSAYKLGECYEYGRMGCPQDAALSIHYYSEHFLASVLSHREVAEMRLSFADIAAQQNHPAACFALTAWYLVGSPGILPQSDTEAYLWAKKSAEMGFPKAEYACGYFTEVRFLGLSFAFFSKLIGRPYLRTVWYRYISRRSRSSRMVPKSCQSRRQASSRSTSKRRSTDSRSSRSFTSHLFF